MEQLAYKRVLLKVSGEALSGGTGTGLDFSMLHSVAQTLKVCAAMGAQIGVVAGAGNFWRGVKNGEGKLDRACADQMGMLGTMMNCLALRDVLEQEGQKARILSALEMPRVAEAYTQPRAERYLSEGKVVLFACGTGNPCFSTDTAAALRAVEIHADALLLAKNVDGVYSADPVKDPSAVKLPRLTYDEVLRQGLGVMDLTATVLAKEHRVPALVFALRDPDNIRRVLTGEALGSYVGV
ncbi:MAG: UMP kinase [Clostridiaceae bacterium]|nr:UMP kinase [Clostridiaceae bacterium]